MPFSQRGFAAVCANWAYRRKVGGAASCVLDSMGHEHQGEYRNGVGLTRWRRGKRSTKSSPSELKARGGILWGNILWLKASELSFEFWEDEEDTVYDSLQTG